MAQHKAPYTVHARNTHTHSDYILNEQWAIEEVASFYEHARWFDIVQRDRSNK